MMLDSDEKARDLQGYDACKLWGGEEMQAIKMAAI